jgi:hypothetical protein
MNDKIKQLAEQAGASMLHGGELSFFGNTSIEKFAELIVRECGEVAYKAYWDNPETVKGIHIQEKIKQHFGVEE